MASNNLKIALGLVLAFFSVITVIGNGGTKPVLTSKNLAGMVKVPAGNYTLFLKSKASKTVAVKSFYLDTRAVTNAEFLEFVKVNPQWAKSKISKLYGDAGYLKHWESDYKLGPATDQLTNSPVTNVSWYAAYAYCKWKGKRLPSLEEWEYVGQKKILNDQRPVEKIIMEWYSKPTPKILPAVGSTYKNELNIYDLHGLIWEWVSDFNSVMVEDDSRSNSAINRDLFCASGSFGASNQEDYAAFMRFAFRGSLKAKYTVNNLGFRCAKDLD